MPQSNETPPPFSRRHVLKATGLTGSLALGVPALTGTAAAHDIEIVFDGCQTVHIVVNDESEFGVLKEAIIVAEGGIELAVDVELTPKNTEPIPDRFGDRPVFTFTASDDRVIRAVSVGRGDQRVNNPNDCSPEPECENVPNDIMLVLDRSGSMSNSADGGTKLEAAQSGATAFINQLDSDDRVGLVSFASQVSANAGLTSDFSAVEDAVNGLSAGGDTNLSEGIATAVNELNVRPEARPTLVVLSNGRADDRSAAINQANAAREAGIRVITIAYGTDADDSTLRAMAGNPRDGTQNFFDAQDPGTIEAVFNNIVQEVC